MKVLAIDAATKTGWAHSSGASGVWNLKTYPDESTGMKLIRFESKLREIIRGVGVDVIVFEAVSVASGKAANLSGTKLGAALTGIIQRVCEEPNSPECKSYNLQTIKAHALRGKEGPRDKDAMLDAAKNRWTDIDIEDHNQADALWMLDLALEELQ